MTCPYTAPPAQIGVQLRLFNENEIDSYRFEDPLPGWSLSGVRAMALDPDVFVRRWAALSNWNIDIRLQRVLADDPDEEVVMHLLSRIDPPREIAEVIFKGPHVQARRDLARRNLSSDILLALIDDDDHVVREAAWDTMRRRGILKRSEPAALQ